jgi:hypothetical protein
MICTQCAITIEIILEDSYSRRKQCIPSKINIFTLQKNVKQQSHTTVQK